VTCIFFGGRNADDPRGVICVNDQIRLHVGNRYIWMSWHSYTGPSFYTTKSGAETEYVPVDENDPVWDAFYRWHENYKKGKK